MAEHYSPKYGNAPKRRKRKKKSSSSPLVLGLVAVMAVLVLMSLGIRMLIGSDGQPVSAEPAAEMQAEIPTEEESGFSLFGWLFGPKETEPEETEPEPEPEHVVSMATIAVTGDILMHMPVINTGLDASGNYNFDKSFRYLTPYSSKADFAVANLETTLCGNDKGYKYSGHPAFNCPDAIVDALKNAGFDLLLTANNHCYDTSEYGFLRTVNTVRGKGLQTLGSRASVEEPKFTVQEINGIRVGMVCYTYEGPPENPVPGTKYMNRNALSPTAASLLNSFLPSNLDPFYMEVQQMRQAMIQAGAEATVIFIHWGIEYQTTPSSEQRSIAQQLCDIGYDVIVGGHPHVVQPVELLTSRMNPDQKTVCLYSTGNALSNQRISEMDLKTGHTEDGLLFYMTFSKYSDDTVYLENVSLLPCWVDLRTEGNREYDILPLSKANEDQWLTDYDLSPEALENAKKSYDRTNDLTHVGIDEVNSYLSAQQAQREADYLAAVQPQSAARPVKGGTI